MEFEIVLKNIIREFEENIKEYALIGGFALGLWDVIRATSDLDFLVVKNKKEILYRIMKKYNFKKFYESENVVQFEAEDIFLGSIDFLYSFRKPSLAMLKRAVYKDVFEGKIRLKVLIPEDLIGLKIQAMVNVPEREFCEWEDIYNLLEKNKNINWDLLQDHFLLFNREEKFKELRRRYEKKNFKK